MWTFIIRLRHLPSRARDLTLPADVHAVRSERLTYLSPERFRRIVGAVRQIARQHIPGDFIEFGIARGG